MKNTSHSGKKQSCKDLAGMIDHTLLRPDATVKEIIQLCQEAKINKFACIFVNPCHISLCVKELKKTAVKVGAAVGFPLGASTTATKKQETEQALREGAKEIDMVINVGLLKSGNYNYVREDISAVVTTAKKYNAIVKVIIETALLTNNEKIRACHIAKRAGADFVKSSTGYSKGGATTKDIVLMRKSVGPHMGVKASGGIRSREEAIAMINSGANRIGTSAGVQIVKKKNNSYLFKKSKKY